MNPTTKQIAKHLETREPDSTTTQGRAIFFIGPLRIECNNNPDAIKAVARKYRKGSWYREPEYPQPPPSVKTRFSKARFGQIFDIPELTKRERLENALNYAQLYPNELQAQTVINNCRRHLDRLPPDA